MYPYFTFVIPSYSLFSTIGFAFAMLFLYYRLPKYNLSFTFFLKYVTLGAAGLLLGSKLLFAVSMIPTIGAGNFGINDFIHYFIHGGIIFYGGLLGLLFFVYALAKYRKENVTNIFNLFIPAVPLFHVWGRLGCLFGGCCYGMPFAWGVRMASMPEVIRFPVQLAESLCNLLIFITIMLNEKKNWIKHSAYLYLYLYAVSRFVLEFFRGDTVRGLWGVLSTSQIVSVGIVIGLTGKIGIANCNKKRECDERLL